MKKQPYALLGIVGAMVLALAACAPTKDQLKKAIVENPEILTEAIEKNSFKIMEALNKAAQSARAEQSKKAEEESSKAIEDEFKNPKKPNIDESRAMIGKADAVLTVIEYSDFECPYCKRGYETVNQIKQKYGDRLRFQFKHLPLPFHPMALPGAKYFEAIAFQSAEKAYKFHDKVFENQEKLHTEKEKLYERLAKEIGVDMKKLKVDLNNPKVMERIEADKAEAKAFDFSGTPGFLVNGVSLKGAYPFPEFEKIIERVLKK